MQHTSHIAHRQRGGKWPGRSSRFGRPAGTHRDPLPAADARAVPQAAKRRRVEAKLPTTPAGLELRVAGRTADLKKIVEALQKEIGRRQQTEQALRESEERYRTLFESAPVGMGISNYAGEVIAFNRDLCSLAGITPEEAQALPASVFHALPGQRRQLLAQLRKRGKVEQSEVLLKRNDGSTLMGLLHMQELRLGREKVLLTVVQDITRQKQNEWHVEGVRELLELFATKTSRQECIESAVRFLREWSGCRCAGIRLTDNDSRIPYAASVGFKRSFLKRENCFSLVTGDCPCLRIFQGRSSASDKQFTSLKGSFFCNCASRLSAQFCPDPAKRSEVACLEARYESLAHTPIRHHGRLLGTIHLADPREDRFPADTIAFIESVAPLIGQALHRFQVEESLAESERRFRSMFERHDVPMLLVEPNSGAIEDANPAAAAFYGYFRELLRTMSVEDLTALPRQTTAELRQRAHQEGRKHETLPQRLATGEVRTVEVHSSPIQIKGRWLLFSIIHDISERKRLEKQILDIGEAERQRIGQDLHDSLGGMLTGVALLSKALAQRLAATANTEAAVAEEVVRCLNESISQTRAIARGLFPAEIKQVGLAAVLAEFATETSARSGVSCCFRADKRALIRDASVARHVFRIVQEAVNNAIRHSEASHITIRLARTSGQIRLEIRDNGKGLPDRQAIGSGLGLRTMKYRADLIGAHFALKSANGRGTVVSCLLPASSHSPRRSA